MMLRMVITSAESSSPVSVGDNGDTDSSLADALSMVTSVRRWLGESREAISKAAFNSDWQFSGSLETTIGCELRHARPTLELRGSRIKVSLAFLRLRDNSTKVNAMVRMTKVIPPTTPDTMADVCENLMWDNVGEVTGDDDDMEGVGDLDVKNKLGLWKQIKIRVILSSRNQDMPYSTVNVLSAYVGNDTIVVDLKKKMRCRTRRDEGRKSDTR
jgi:hypothetical protein